MVYAGMAVMWTLVFGFGSGATMILGLTFIGLRASSAHQAAALSGMAQSIGYLLAACGPPLMGKIHDTQETGKSRFWAVRWPP
jgi:CP family cyanate transporter-like MFS transporter